MRLSVKQQHEKNAAQILGKIYTSPVEENQHTTAAKAILDSRNNQSPEEEEQRSAIQETAESLMKLKKEELQEICITREILFVDDETKAQLVEKILG